MWMSDQAMIDRINEINAGLGITEKISMASLIDDDDAVIINTGVPRRTPNLTVETPLLNAPLPAPKVVLPRGSIPPASSDYWHQPIRGADDFDF